MKRRLFAVFALCAVACQKPGDGKVEVKDGGAGGAANAGAGATAVQSAAGGEVQAAATVTACPQSLGGTDKLHRVISKDCGVVPVTEDYYIDGGSLTLEAGASLSFKDGVGLFVGYYEPARLIVKGSAAEPVVLTAAGDRAPGAWRGVSLNSHAARSALAGLVIEFAGTDESALFVDAEDITIRELTIRDAKGAGLLISDTAGFAELAALTFKKLGRPAAIDLPARAVAALGGGHHFDAGAQVQVRGGTVARGGKWQPPGAPLLIAGEVNVDGEGGQRATLELAPGLELRFTEAGALTVGYYSLAGLTAAGTAEAPITFTAHERRERGGWRGVGVHAQGEAKIEHALFEYGGKVADEGALQVRGGALTVNHTTFRNDAIGVSLDDGAKLQGFAHNTFVATPVAAVLPAGALAGLGEGNAYDRDSKIRCPGGDVKGKATWHAQGAAIELGGEVRVEGGELVIEPGVALLAAADVQLTVGFYERASLRIAGTAASPVTIGAAEGGNWRGISLASQAHTNVLEHLVLTGASNEAAIQVEREVDARLTGVTCSKCSGAVVGWGCGAKVTSAQVLATDGTPKIEARPEGC